MSKKFMAALIAALMVVSMTMPALAADSRSAFTIHQYAYLADTPDVYWVGVSNRTDGRLNSYSLIAPCDMEIRLKPTERDHTFKIWRDGKATEISVGSAECKLSLKAGEQISLEITKYYPDALRKGNWSNKELPTSVDEKTFTKWYKDKGGVPAYAGGYSTIPKWDSVRTANIAGLHADLFTDSAGSKSFRFTAPQDIWLTKLSTDTTINVWVMKSVEVKAGTAFILKKGETLSFEVKEWEKAVVLGDVEILK